MKRASIGTAAVLLWGICTPAVAFAEETESAAGPSILLPKMAEFIPALVIFLVIMLVLAKFAWPRVLDMLQKREDTIQQSIDQAEEIRVQAAATRDEADAVIADARRQASEIILAARGDADKERAHIVAVAHTEAEDIIAKAHDRAADEQRRIYANATESIAKASVAVAGKIVGERLADDNEAQRELIKKYIAEVGSLNG